MKKLTRNWICIIIVLAACLLQARPLYASTWEFWMPVSTDSTLQLWALHTATDGRVGLGPYLAWQDEPDSEDVAGLVIGDRYDAGAVASYDLTNNDATISIGSFVIPVMWSIGVKAGVRWAPEIEDLDPASGLFTALHFGDSRASIAVIYEYDVSEALWSVNVPNDETHTISVAPVLRF